MKNLQFHVLSLFIVTLMVFFFAACEKDEINMTITEPIPPTTTNTATSPVVGRLAANGAQQQSSSSTGGLEVECINIDYPFDFDVDDVIYTISDLSDLNDLFTNVVNSSTMSIDFVYPLSISLEDGTAASAEDGEELAAFVASCTPTRGWGNGFFPAFFFDSPTCVSIIYPFTLSDADSMAIEIQDQNDFINALAANPNLWFAFPLSVEDLYGIQTFVEDQDVLFDILARCAISSSSAMQFNNPSVLLGLSCFNYNYPINIFDSDGNTTSIADINEFSAAILNGDFENFEYSFTVTWGPVGLLDTINNLADFHQLVQNCTPHSTQQIGLGTLLTNAFVDSCFSLIYPFTAGTIGDTLQINNRDELNSLAASNIVSFIVFPIDVQQGSQIITLNNAQEYNNLVFNCNQAPILDFFAEAFIAKGLDLLGCYDLIYPITITNSDGTTSDLSDETEARNFLLGSNSLELIQFPIDVIDRSTGTTLTFQDLVEYSQFTSNCDASGLFTVIPIESFLAFGPGPSNQNCYGLIYPFTLINNMDTTTITLNSNADLNAYLPGSVNDFVRLPVDVTEQSTGTTISFQTFGDFSQYVNNCR